MDQDDVDTAPVVDRSDARVTSRSELVDPDETVELVLEPASPLVNPTLFLRSTGSHVAVEAVLLDSIEVFPDGTSVDDCRMGRAVPGTVSTESPLKVVVSCRGPVRSTVTASLVPQTPPSAGTYRMGPGEVNEEG